MLDAIKQFFIKYTRSIMLLGYGWKRRRTIYLGKPAVQWRDPMSFVWVSENAAMKLLTVQVMDEYHRR